MPSNDLTAQLTNLRRENVRLQQQLSQTETYNRLVLDSATDYGVITADASGRITDWSEGATLIFGWAKQEMLGKSLHQIFTPEDCANGVPEREIGGAVSQGRADDDRWHMRADGQRFMASGVMMPMLQGGNLVGVVKVVRDVTSRLEAEERSQLYAQQMQTQFQEIADSIPQLVWISDPQGNDLYFNHKWLEFSGLSSEQLQGQAWKGLMPELTRERVSHNRSKAMQNQASWEDTFQMKGQDGKDIWFLCRALPIRNESGDIVRWFSTCTDVNAMHKQSSQFEQDSVELRADAQVRSIELNAMQGELKTSQKGQAAAEDQVRQLQKMEAVGQLTGGIAHDFNNMLTIIVGGLNLLKARLDRGESKVEKFIEMALDGTTRATQLTHRLLAFSRQQALSPEPVDLNRLVTGMSDMLQRTLGKDIKLEFVRHAGLWPIFADFSSLEQALLNLCVNARDAMSDGGRITVETGNVYMDDNYASQEQMLAGEYVMVAVTDTGAGITSDVLARVFEPYFTTKGVGKGTGLGLAQVYGFAKQSLGHIKLYSEVGFGTSAKLYLPRYLGKDQPTERMAVQENHVPYAVSNQCVLVVEDDPKVRAVSLELLKELGYQVLEAESGRVALQLLADHPEITLLFTDVVMPEMTGRQLMDEVSHSKPNLPVLYTTGYTRNAIVHNGMLDRGVSLLPKPFTLRELALKIRQVLDQ